MLEPASVHRIAVPSWLVESGEDRFGEVTRATRGQMLRDALIAHVRENGFPSAQGTGGASHPAPNAVPPK